MENNYGWVVTGGVVNVAGDVTAVSNGGTRYCRHCGKEIWRDGVVWVHAHSDTITGTTHITCGYDGEYGTSAEPA